MSDRLAGRLVAIAAILAIVALVWHEMAIVGDGFWMIATGRWILAHGMPKGDPFSFASTGDWTVVSAGACVLFAKVTDLFGLRGLEAFATGIETLAVALLLLGSARTALARVALAPLALFFVFVDAEDLSARGQIFGDLLLVLLFGTLARMRAGRRVHPALHFVLVAVWINVHLSALSGVLLPLVAAGLVFFESRRLARDYAVLALVGAAALCVNPYGPAYVPLALRTAFESSTTSFDLFQSPNFHDLAWLAAPALGVALLAVLGRRRDPFGAAFLVFFLLAACRSRRFATALVAVEIGLLGPILDEHGKARRPIPALVGGAVALLGVAAYFFATEGWRSKDPLRDVPAAGAAIARKSSGVATPLHWGGYLAYAWMGQPRYFLDGRDHVFLFNNGAVDDGAELWNGSPRSFEILDAYGIDTVLWEKGSPLDGMLRGAPGWQLVFSGPIEIVYARTAR